MRKIHPSAEQAKLAALEAEVRACQALCRAGLHALAALSPTAGRAAELALEREADAADNPLAARRLAAARDQLAGDPAEQRLASAIERALVQAAEALQTCSAA